MPTTVVRIDGATRETLRRLAEQSQQSMQEIVSKAIEEYRRKQLCYEADVAYAALRNDPEAWQAELEERRAWEQTLNDGVEPNETGTKKVRKTRKSSLAR